MRKHIQNIFSVVFLLSVTLGFSQRKPNDTLNTGVIDVVKPYVPTISDAFKVKETPSLDDENTDTKKEIKYNIFSFPVASTFTPAKGNPASVEKAKRVRLYDNYASFGMGSFRTFLGEFYVNHMISRSESAGGYISHHSSKGGIEDAVVNNGFSNSKLRMNYSSTLRDLTWKVDGGFQHQFYNWYGIPEPIASDNVLIYYLDVGHSYFDIDLGSEFTFEDSYVNSASVLLRRFSDSRDSAENRALIKADMEVPINDFEISTAFKLDYLSGNFDRLYEIDEAYKYSNFQLGISPSFQYIQDDVTVNLGVNLVYLNDMEAGENKFYVYPNISASYRFVDELLIAYGGVKGDLVQNTYHAFANENPFVSPTLIISPTDQTYNAFAGLKGKATSTVSYNVGGHYTAEKYKPLYKANTIKVNSGENDYDYGNSFGIVYDDVTTFGVSGELNVDINRNFKLGTKLEYFAYNTDREEEAWNLPDITGSVFFDYQIDEQWFAGANLFYVGKRKDQRSLETALEHETVTLDSYFDINLNGGYHVNEQFSVFMKANNIANNAYQKWMNYPVQTFQIIAGATYKFDF
ncbi:TonB-dependent receptor [Tamlana sp. I1]|uniref:TonB-dependent receptor n=1 Tax=Tamlana sp. I1 TaxID=2762061 RepID=UPI00188F9C74|nr:TonB-dependent receptor [Tamlana sp. I1]